MEQRAKRILLVDDNIEIHNDFRKILNREGKYSDALDSAKEKLFGEIKKNPNASSPPYSIDSAFQGQEALELVKKSIAENYPYALIFVDIRMPPGWDGIVTTQKLWEIDPDVQIVICSAHSDYSWEEISTTLNSTDNLLILKKPFDVIEIRQLASALTKKWSLNQQVQYQVNNLEHLISSRTEELDESLSLLRATMESTQEGILVLDEKQKILLYNQKFLEIWGFSEEHMANDSHLLWKEIAKKLDDSSSFLTMISNVCKERKQNLLKECYLNTGEILEIYVHPRYFNEQSKGVVLSFREVTERKALEDQLLHQATHDSLTGLPNRALLIDRMVQALTFARQNKLNIGVIMMDLDNFKYINDSLGHHIGDKLLNAVGKKLQGNFRQYDTVARFGGDEFAIIIARTRLEDIAMKANKLLELFLEPFSIDGQHLAVTSSIGISVYPKDGKTPNELLKNADSALYNAKGLGKNNFKLYTSEYNDNLVRRIELKTALQHAFDRQQFLLHYQPLLRLDTNQIIGLEALLRWKHPEMGIIPPCNFISVAEESGLIVAIGSWVLKTACLQMKKWHKDINPELTIAVNVSGRQIMQNNFVDMVKEVLQETQFDPQFLELEITESIILENSSYIANTMSQLKALGIKLAMDDFGVGYSSLNYVKYFPFDKIKIDKSFIDGINLNIDDKNIVEAIINMTKAMGLQVLAEGVETKEQIDFLNMHHSSQIQGYYISPPLDLKHCAHFLKKSFKPKC